MDAMRYKIGQWSKSDLTPFGKITVLKSLVLSKIVHVQMSLPNPSRKYLKESEKNVFLIPMEWKTRSYNPSQFLPETRKWWNKHD